MLVNISIICKVLVYSNISVVSIMLVNIMLVIIITYFSGCIDDIRFEGKSLPLPPYNNVTKWAQAPVAHNVEQNCLSNKSCVNIECPEPFQCVDLWNDYSCM